MVTWSEGIGVPLGKGRVPVYVIVIVDGEVNDVREATLDEVAAHVPQVTFGGEDEWSSAESDRDTRRSG